MFIAGGISGYKSGEPFDRFALGALACFAAVLQALMVLILSRWVEWDWSLVPSLLLGWLELFVWAAVPCVLMGWIKARQDKKFEQ